MHSVQRTPAPEADPRERRVGQRRDMAVVGLLGSVVRGSLRADLVPAAWALGLVGFPAVLLAWQWLRARRTTARFDATGTLGFALNCGIFFAFYLTPFYVPALAFTSDAALRGYAGCEVLAISNWLLRRDDQVGCVVFAPIDLLESHTGRG